MNSNTAADLGLTRRSARRVRISSLDVATALKVCKASTAIESFKSYILLHQSLYENDASSSDSGKKRSPTQE